MSHLKKKKVGRGEGHNYIKNNFKVEYPVISKNRA